VRSSTIVSSIVVRFQLSLGRKGLVRSEVDSGLEAQFGFAVMFKQNPPVHPVRFFAALNVTRRHFGSIHRPFDREPSLVPL
jgi:hypothetical protein